MSLFKKLFGIKEKQVLISEEELIQLSIQEKLKDYKKTQGPAEFSGALVLPRADRGHVSKMEFEIVSYEL